MIFAKYMPEIINVIGCRSSFTHTRDGEQSMKARKHLLCRHKSLKPLWGDSQSSQILLEKSDRYLWMAMISLCCFTIKKEKLVSSNKQEKIRKNILIKETKLPLKWIE